MVDKSINFGQGEAVVDLAEFEAEDRAKHEMVMHFAPAVRTAIMDKGFKPPMLPETAIRLSEMVDKADVSIKEVEATVVRDPTVTARIVAVANSVFYSRGAQVRSLKDAIMRLGLSELRDVAFQTVAKTTIFRVPGFSERMRELFEAAQAAGLFARRICQILKYQSESAYLCGLLHDMGQAIILGVAVPNTTMPPLEREALMEAVNIYHAQTGAMVSAMWGLPDMVCDAILFHHHPERSRDPSQMALVTAVADLMSAHVGFGVLPRTIRPLDEPLFYKLNLSPADVESLLRYAEEVYEHREALDPE